MKRYLGIPVLVLAFIALESLSRLGVDNSVILPTPSWVLGSFSDSEFVYEMLGELGNTLKRTAIGFGLALLSAAPIGLSLGTSRTLRSALIPIIELVRPIPSSAIIPVAILFLGLGTNMIVFVIWFGTFWPLLMNSMYGAQSVSQRHNDLSKILRFSVFEKFLNVILPTAVPQIFAGLRISLSIALILAVTAEMLAGQNGLGYFILDYERAFRYSQMYAVIVILAIVGLFLNSFLLVIQKSLRRRFPELD